jgi:hypothetical protein
MTAATLTRPLTVGEAIGTVMAAMERAPDLEDRLIDVGDTLKAYVLLSEAQQEDMRGLRDASLAAHREVTRLTATNEAVNAQLHRLHLERADDERAWENMRAQLQDAIGDLSRLLSYTSALRTHHHTDHPKTPSNDRQTRDAHGNR